MVAQRLDAATRFPGKLSHRQTGTGEQRPPQQEFLTARNTRAVLATNGAPSSCFPENSNKKYPATSCEVFCGAPSGTRTQDPLIKRYSVLVPYVFPFLHFVDFTLFLCTFLVFTFPLLPFISFNFPHLLEHNLSKNP